MERAAAASRGVPRLPGRARRASIRARIADPAYRNERAEAAVFTLNWASATGTAILLAALATALFLRVSLAQFLPSRA